MCNNPQKGNQRIVLIFAIACYGLFASAQNVLAQEWTQTIAPTNNWTGIASSADGTKLVAVSNGGGIYTSPDSGNTWTLAANAPISVHWVSVSSSADGNKLVAAGGNLIYTSADSGVTWVTNSVPSVLWTSVASPGDGSVLVAGAPFAHAPYVSTNFGTTWSAAPLPSNDKNYATISADGKQLAAALQVGRIYTSTNFGTTWITNTSPGLNYSAIASSADGSHLAAVWGGSSIFISADFGRSWLSNNIAGQDFVSISASANGSRLVAAANGLNGVRRLFTSSDFGMTWVSNTISSGGQFSVATSADGNRLMAVANGSSIWIAQITPDPRLNIALSSTNLALSWIIPSTNFVVQQSADLISWSSVTDMPMLNFAKLNYELSISPTNNSGFYRLATP